MKNPPRLLPLLAGLLILATPVLRAQSTPATPPADTPPPPPADGQGQGHRRGPGAMLEHLAKELNLTADQQAKWKEIGAQEKTALDAIRADTSLAKEDRRAKAMETNKTFMAQRRALLTPDQQKQFDEAVAKMRERGPRGPKPDKPDGN